MIESLVDCIYLEVMNNWEWSCCNIVVVDIAFVVVVVVVYIVHIVHLTPSFVYMLVLEFSVVVIDIVVVDNLAVAFVVAVESAVVFDVETVAVVVAAAAGDTIDHMIVVEVEYSYTSVSTVDTFVLLVTKTRLVLACVILVAVRFLPLCFRLTLPVSF